MTLKKIVIVPLLLTTLQLAGCGQRTPYFRSQSQQEEQSSNQETQEQSSEQGPKNLPSEVTFCHYYGNRILNESHLENTLELVADNYSFTLNIERIAGSRSDYMLYINNAISSGQCPDIISLSVTQLVYESDLKRIDYTIKDNIVDEVIDYCIPLDNNSAGFVMEHYNQKVYGSIRYQNQIYGFPVYIWDVMLIDKDTHQDNVPAKIYVYFFLMKDKLQDKVGSSYLDAIKDYIKDVCNYYLDD